MNADDTNARSAEGIGIGLRPAFADQLFDDESGAAAWVEIHPENYVERGGAAMRRLDAALERMPVIPHGLTQCFGNIEPFDDAYLAGLRRLLKRIDAPWYSDHLCFCAFGGAHSHDLLPIPRTEETIKHCAARIRELQDRLERPVAIENVSQYIDDASWPFSEHDFLRTIAEESGALLLLDVNNVYVNAQNHGFDAWAYIASLPSQQIAQIHMAGHMVRRDGLRIDTHSEAICADVFSLLEKTLTYHGDIPVLLERDGNYPAWAVLKEELASLRAVRERALQKREANQASATKSEEVAIEPTEMPERRALSAAEPVR